MFFSIKITEMANKIYKKLHSFFMPSQVQKELIKQHEKTVSNIWDALYENVYKLSTDPSQTELMFEYPLYKTYNQNGWTLKEYYGIVNFTHFSLQIGDFLHLKSHLDDTIISIYVVQKDEKVKVFLDVVYRDNSQENKKDQ